MNFLTACARVLASVFAVLFIVTALLSLLLFNAERHFIDPDLYKGVLLEEGVYDSLPRLLATQITQEMRSDPCTQDPSLCESENAAEKDEGGPPEYFKNLDEEQWHVLLGEILTPDWLQAQSESVIDQFFDFLSSDQESPDISISLIELKSSLLGRGGVETVLTIVEAQPACNEEQLRELKETFSSEEAGSELIACRPPDEILNEYMSSLEERLEEVVGDLPDELDLGKNVLGTGENSSEGGMQIGRSIRRVTIFMRLSPILPALFLLLVTIFGVRSFRDLLRWWGIPILMTGMIALTLSLLSMPIFNGFLRTYVQGRIPPYLSIELVQLGFEVGRLTLRSYLTSIATQGGLMALAGIFAVGISAFMQPRRNDQSVNIADR